MAGLGGHSLLAPGERGQAPRASSEAGHVLPKLDVGITLGTGLEPAHGKME